MDFTQKWKSFYTKKVQLAKNECFWPEFLLYHPPAVLSIGKLHKNFAPLFPETTFCELLAKLCFVILTKALHSRPPLLLPRSQVKISTNFMPTFCAIFQLVIYKNLWYNTGVPNEGATPKSHLKKT